MPGMEFSTQGALGPTLLDGSADQWTHGCGEAAGLDLVLYGPCAVVGGPSEGLGADINKLLKFQRKVRLGR